MESVLKDNKTYGIIGRIGTLSIAKFRCKEEKYNSFRNDPIIHNRIMNNIMQLEVIRMSSKYSKIGVLSRYVTFTVACPHVDISNTLIAFKKHDINKLYNEIKEMQLT